jgi:Transposase, Mutator family
LWLDALTQKVREGGRGVQVAVVIATGVNADGQREILGVDRVTTEDGAGWLSFLRSLVARGLSGVKLVISDAHEGLVDAIGSVLVGAGWQRCRTHVANNLRAKTPTHAWPMVAGMLKSVFEQHTGTRPTAPLAPHARLQPVLAASRTAYTWFVGATLNDGSSFLPSPGPVALSAASPRQSPRACCGHGIGWSPGGERQLRPGAGRARRRRQPARQRDRRCRHVRHDTARHRRPDRIPADLVLRICTDAGVSGTDG